MPKKKQNPLKMKSFRVDAGLNEDIQYLAVKYGVGESDAIRQVIRRAAAAHRRRNR